MQRGFYFDLILTLLRYDMLYTVKTTITYFIYTIKQLSSGEKHVPWDKPPLVLTI